MNTRAARRQIPRNTVKEFVESDLPDETLKQEVGAERSTLKKWLEDNPSPAAVYQAPVTALPTQPKKESEKTATPTAATESPKMTPQQIESKVTPAAKTTSGQKLTNATKQNLDLGIQPKKTQVVSQTINKVNQSKKQTPIIDKLDQLTVRNPEETFQRMIFYSTRVV